MARSGMEELFRTLSDASPEMIYFIDTENVVRYVNKAGLVMWNRDHAAMVGKHLDELYPPEIASRHAKAIQTVIRSGQGLATEIEEVFPERKCWIDVRLSPVRDPEGEIIGVLGLSQDISARKQAEQSLRESEDRYKTLTEKTNTGVMLTTLDGRFLHVNQAAAEIGGYGSADEFKGQSVMPFYADPEDRKAIIAELHGKGSVRNFKVRLKKKDDSIVWVSMDAVFLHEGAGKPPHILSSIQDISEEKKQEDRLLVQRDMSVALSGIADLDRGLELCLDAALHVSDMDCGGVYLIDKNTGDLELRCHKGLSPAFIESVSRFSRDSENVKVVHAGRPSFDSFQRLPVPKDDVLSREGLRAIAVIPFSHENRVIGCLNISSHSRDDIAPQLKIGLEIIAGQIGNQIGRVLTEDALRKSEARYRSIVEHVNDGFLIHDFHGTILDCNDNLCTMLGYSHQELVGASLTTIDSPRDRSLMPQRLRENIETGRLVFDGEHVRKDGTRVAVSISSRVVSRDGNGTVQTFVRDITERKKMEEEIQKAEKLESLGVLAAGIAHDFNNMLAGLFGFMDLARQSLRPGDEASEYLGKAFLSFERAKSLSRQLLTFAKGGAPVKKAVSLTLLVHECCDLALSGSNVKYHCSLPEGLLAVEGDEHQLAQVFSNIIINSRQAMPEGGTLTITAENVLPGSLPPAAATTNGGPYVRIVFLDQGVGIPGKILGKIFDPFFTTKQQGSGLGLAICYSIVRRHGGHIEAASKPGEGTAITVWLRAAAAEALNDPQIDRKDLSGTGRILVMDDERMIHEMARQVLMHAGYSVETADDGKEAVRKFIDASGSGRAFDLVILDLTVPGGMGGKDALPELRKIEPRIPAVMSTGYADGASLSDPAVHGFDAVLPKPYRAVELLKTVKEVIKKKNAGDR